MEQKLSTLFHCLYNEPQGKELRTTCKREVNGHTASFLFAATHLSKALAFAFSYHDNEVLMNGDIEGTEDEFIIIGGGQKTLDKPRNITVLSFPSDGFENMEGARQCVSEKPMPFEKTQTVLKTTDINDLMRNGLQIFLLPDDLNKGSLDEINSIMESQHLSLGSGLQALMDQKNMRWINQERNINVNSDLLADIKKHQPEYGNLSPPRPING